MSEDQIEVLQFEKEIESILSGTCSDWLTKILNDALAIVKDQKRKLFQLDLVKKEITTPQTLAWMGSAKREQMLSNPLKCNHLFTDSNHCYKCGATDD